MFLIHNMQLFYQKKTPNYNNRLKTHTIRKLPSGKQEPWSDKSEKGRELKRDAKLTW